MTTEKHDPELDKLIESAKRRIGQDLRTAYLIGIVDGAEQAICAMVSPPVAADAETAKDEGKEAGIDSDER